MGLGWYSPSLDIYGSTVVCEHTSEMPATCNTSEYLSLLHALEAVRPHVGGRDIAVFYGDSKLVVEQVDAKWTIREAHLQVLRDRVWDVLMDYPCDVEVSWIPREENIIADRLSREVSNG